MKIKLFISLILLSFAFKVHAGEPDTNYVQKFKNIFAAKVFLVNNGFSYSLTPLHNSSFTSQQLKDAEVIYSPHIPPAMGVAMNIKGIAFVYVFKFTNDYLDTTGLIKAGFKQFQMNIYGNKYGFEGYYQNYSRFYFHYKGDGILPKNYNTDIRAYQWGVNNVFILNGEHFSYNAAFNQTQFQKKSAGSPLVNVALKFNEIKSHDLIPDSVKKFYPDLTGLQRNRNYSFLVQGGYAFNLTKKKFYYSTALMAGVGIQHQTYHFELLTKQNKTGFPLIGRIKASAGYNGKTFFSGLFGNIDITQSSITTVRTRQMVYSYGVYVGFRAIELKKYKKSRKQIHEEEKQKKIAEKQAKQKAKEKKKK